MDPGQIWYALAWASFGVLHSVLASRRLKNALASVFGAAYRAAYNLFAVVHLGAIVWLGKGWVPSAPLGFPGWLGTAGDIVSLAGIVLCIGAFARYDRGLFVGLSQLRGRGGEAPEPLRTDGMNRCVRHPAYSGLFLLLWGHAQTEFALATALWASLYLFIGTYFEERRLVALYGDAYRTYRERVPAFVPWRGRGV
jgi:protein-S-isoprenylcysteine O-methyltransferase Ste14